MLDGAHPRPEFQGWEGIAHGGIVATILDEVMGWALAAADAWGYTAKLSIAYRRPVPVGTRDPRRGAAGRAAASAC